MKWKEFLRLKDQFVGRDLELFQPGSDISRGPIASVEVEGDWVEITLGWRAELEGSKWGISRQDAKVHFSTNCFLFDPGDGRLLISWPGSHMDRSGLITVHPAGANLDPLKVNTSRRKRPA